MYAQFFTTEMPERINSSLQIISTLRREECTKYVPLMTPGVNNEFTPYFIKLYTVH